MRWACLAAFFFSIWGWMIQATGDAGWNRCRVFPAGQSSRRGQCTGAGPFFLTARSLACMIRHARNTHCPPPPPLPYHHHHHLRSQFGSRLNQVAQFLGKLLCEPQRSTRRCMANSLEPPQGGGSDVCARGFDTSGRRSRWSWPRPVITPLVLSRRRSRRGGWQAKTRTTPNGDRGRPGQLGGTPTSSWSRECRGGSRRLRARALVVLLRRHCRSSGGDTLDALTLSILVQQAVMAQEKVEKKRKEKEMQELFARRTAECLNSLSQSSSSTSQKRRKKRKKKKLPKTSSHTSRAPWSLAVTCLSLVLPEEYLCRFSGR